MAIKQSVGNTALIVYQLDLVMGNGNIRCNYVSLHIRRDQRAAATAKDVGVIYIEGISTEISG
jgi:hypothetical protein